MKLYSFDISNYGNIIKQTLLEEGISYELVVTAPNQEAEFLAISPMGKVPAVETSQGPICETRAILSYIAASHPENKLFPTDAYTRGQHEELYSLVDLNIEHQARRQLGEVFFGAPRNESTYAEVKTAVARGLQALSSRFSPAPYVSGEYSVADIYLFHCLNLASSLMQASYDWDILAEVDGLSEWFDAVKNREITQQVLADQAAAMKAMMEARG